MKEDLRQQLTRDGRGSADARNRVREYLQARILASLQRSGAMIPLAFQGGTALRFLDGIQRYSEDLDFTLDRPDRGYDFQRFLRAIQADLSAQDLHHRPTFQKPASTPFPGSTSLCEAPTSANGRVRGA